MTLDGKVVGQHRGTTDCSTSCDWSCDVSCAGHHLFTIGQRTRISGVGHEAWFIARKDIEHNRLTVVSF